jgi:hypothetical protein
MIGEVSFGCYWVLPGLSQMLLIVSKIQAESALPEFYNETRWNGSVSLAMGITNAKNTQKVNN